MTRYKQISVLLLAAASITACKKKEPKEDLQPPVPITYSNYTAMKEGNYWVYERYDIDAAGNETATGLYDSMYVAKDTTINGKVYHTYMWNFYQGDPYVPQYLRDSAHYVVDNKGEVVFSSLDFTHDFKTYYYTMGGTDTVALVKHRMADNGYMKATPAGVFKTSAFRKDFYMHPPYDRNGKVRSIIYRYAEGIGMVSEILPWYLTFSNYTERRLVRYHVAK